MDEGAEGRNSRGDDDVYYYIRWRLAEVRIDHAWPLPALGYWEMKVESTSMKDVGGACFAGSSPPFLGRERAAVDVDPERRSPRYHETCLPSHGLFDMQGRGRHTGVSKSSTYY